MKMDIENSCFKGMTHDQILDAIRYGLRYLTTTDLVGKHSSFMDYRIEATDWNEKMLTKMHKTIILEGRPVSTKDSK